MHIKHKEIIKAWLDGAKIEMMDGDGIWRIVENPHFREYGEYRAFKPEVPTPQWYFVNGTRPDWLNQDDYIEYYNSYGGPYRGTVNRLAFEKPSGLSAGYPNKILFIRLLKD